MSQVCSRREELKAAGVEDSRFYTLNGNRFSFLVIVLMRGKVITKCIFTRVEVDGFDATDKLISALHSEKLDVIMLAGISFAGFNLIDPKRVHAELKIPVIVVIRKKPNTDAMKNALKKHFPDWRRRLEVIEKAGPIYAIKPTGGPSSLYVELAGISVEEASSILRDFSICSRVPEPLRVARLIAKSLPPGLAQELYLENPQSSQI